MRHNKGLQYHQKSFSVPMGGETIKDNLCWTCANNHYHGGDVVLCVECKNYSNYKTKNEDKPV